MYRQTFVASSKTKGEIILLIWLFQRLRSLKLSWVILTYTKSSFVFFIRVEKETLASHLGRHLKERRYVSLVFLLHATLSYNNVPLSKFLTRLWLIFSATGLCCVAAFLTFWLCVLGRPRGSWPGWNDWPRRSEGKTTPWNNTQSSLLVAIRASFLLASANFEYWAPWNIWRHKSLSQ